MKYLLFTLFLFFQDSLPVSVNVPTETVIAQENRLPSGTPVSSDSTFSVYNGIGPYSAIKRAARIKVNLEKLKTSGINLELLTVKPNTLSDDIVCGDLFVMSVNDEDALALGLSRQAATEFYKELIVDYVQKKENIVTNITSLLINIAIALVIVGLFILGLKYYNRLFRLVYVKINAQKGKLFNGFNLNNYELLQKEKQVLFIIYGAKVLRIAILIIIIYLLLPVIFSLFPWTQPIANKLIGYVLTPIKSIGLKFINYIPSLLSIVVIWFVTKYFLKLLSFFRDEVLKGRLELPGFYPEWAKPTYTIIKAVVIALAFVGVWPLLPMSDSDIFKGVSTFVGLLLALGGSSAISNVIAGILITYMRAFEIGDRVMIGEVVGDVKERSILNTRVKTIKNEIITIPNSQMLNSHTINYTSANDEEGLILHTTITIGYDVPWRQVHELLIAAALKTEFVKKLPKPYVLQTSLDDFYVSYQLNARTREIQKMALIYSEMHKNIQDKFNEAGIEILSPHYGAHRDGNTMAIPTENLPKDYEAPWFRFKKD